MSDQPQTQLSPDQKRALSFVKNPENWPRWPWLPMKRRVVTKDGFTDLEIGMFYADLVSFFPNHNIYEKLTPEIKPIKTTPEQLIRDGWEPD